MIPCRSFRSFWLILLGFAWLPLGAQTPTVAFIYADACEAPDGKGEFLVLDNSTQPLAITDLTLTTPSGLRICQGCFTGWYTADVSNLNTIAGCGTLFVGVGPGDVVPANARLVIFTNRNFKDDVDWSNFCGEGPIYVTTINRVDNSDKYTHNDGSCTGEQMARTTIDFGASYSSASQTVEYGPCSMPLETPSGSGGGNGIVFSEDGAGAYREVGCDLFYIDDATLESDIGKPQLLFPHSTNVRTLQVMLADKSIRVIQIPVTTEEDGRLNFVLGNLQGQTLERGIVFPGEALSLDKSLPTGLYWLYLHSGTGGGRVVRMVL